MSEYKIGSLFSGIGGLDRGLEMAGLGRVVWHSEIDPYGSKILAKHWPDAANLGDITQIDWHNVEPVDIMCGGFPCQDVSVAGKRAGLKEGTRSGLWANYAYGISVLRPRVVVVENVPGLLVPDKRGRQPAGIGRVLGDLAEIGYDAEWRSFPAAYVGAPHLRWRVCLVAAPRRTFDLLDGRGGAAGEVADTGRERLEGPEPQRERISVVERTGDGGGGVGDVADPDDSARTAERGERAPAEGEGARGRDDRGGGPLDAEREGPVLSAGEAPGGGPTDVADADDDGRERGVRQGGQEVGGPLADGPAGEPGGPGGSGGPTDVPDPDGVGRDGRTGLAGTAGRGQPADGGGPAYSVAAVRGGGGADVVLRAPVGTPEAAGPVADTDGERPDQRGLHAGEGEEVPDAAGRDGIVDHPLRPGSGGPAVPAAGPREVPDPHVAGLEGHGGPVEHAGQRVPGPRRLLARQGRDEHHQFDADPWWFAEPDLGDLAHGLPAELAARLPGGDVLRGTKVPRLTRGIPERVGKLKALGNAVVPQVGLWVGLCIKENLVPIWESEEG